MKPAAAEFADPEQRKKRRGRGIGSGICNRPSRAALVRGCVELCCEYNVYMLLYQHQFDIVDLHPDTRTGPLA
jgi:hypothetical protein